MQKIQLVQSRLRVLWETADPTITLHSREYELFKLPVPLLLLTIRAIFLAGPRPVIQVTESQEVGEGEEEANLGRIFHTF